jgi:hypothetical protein
MILHWYCISFRGRSLERPGSEAYAHAFSGSQEKRVTIKALGEAKRSAKVCNDAICLGISYMGFMTQEELEG